MLLLHLLLPALLTPATAFPQNPTTPSLNTLEPRSISKARCWTGAAFPALDHWAPFSTIFANAQPVMLAGGDTAGEVAGIKAAVLSYAASSGIDARLILAIIMRESAGRTTAKCGDGGKSCGLMQVQGTTVPTCTAHPCANATISAMIGCGVVGGCGGQGANLQYCLEAYGATKYGKTARCYNTGSVQDGLDLTLCKYGIRSYVSDVANLLVGSTQAKWQALEASCFTNNTCSG